MTTLRSSAPPAEPAAPAPDRLSPVTDEGPERELPLSPRQERLWFLHQLEPNSRSRALLRGLRILGRADAARLEWALNELIRRHEALRALFPTKEGRPAQVIGPPCRWVVPMADLTDVPPGEREERARRVAREHAAPPFDPAGGPLFRPLRILLAPEEQWLVIAAHPLVFDGGSLAVLARELAALYEIASDRSRAALPAPRSYTEWARRQREELQGAELQAQLAEWKRQLAGRLPLLELPGDRPRPVAPSHAAARQPIALSGSFRSRIEAASERLGVTPWVTLLAAFLTLLHRYTGDQDLLVGTPVPGDRTAEWERLIGPLENRVVLRVDLSGQPSFAELRRRVREVTEQALERAGVPFEAVVDAIQPARDPSRSPLFQVFFELCEKPSLRVERAGLRFEALELEAGTTEYDLTLHLSAVPTGFEGWLEYATDLFDGPTIARMASHFEALLEGATADPDCRLAALPLLTPGERQQVLVECNETRAELPVAGCWHRLFEAQVARAPEAVAAVFESQSLTYSELNAQANQLAHFLREQGVGPEVRVGLCVERSLAMLVALLGILKAGGAYVPLDPAFPRERLAWVLADAGVPLLLTQEALRGQLPPHPAREVCLDDVPPLFAGYSTQNLSETPEPEQLAYVLYTSGSTGQPKGVAIPHRALLNFLSSMQRQPGLAAADRLLAVTTLAFDIAGLELYLPLLVGGRVEIAAREVTADPRRLAERLATAGTTVMQATPATWRMLLASGWAGAPGLTALCGGEALPGELAARLRERCAALWNLYGPTETTIWSTLRRVDGGAAAQAVVSIGGPIANTQVYVLDRQFQPAPIGVPGELCIGGTGLARGYLNRPGLTAEKFVPDPFSGEPGGRLYRTGDRARWLADGSLEFLGRLDHQVKLRGFRIELGEIEAALRRHPRIRDAVVVARDAQRSTGQTAGEQRLVAYVTAVEGAAPGSGELREWLQERLPPYMVPSLFIALPSLPLTPNGKVDRRALPDPAAAEPEEREFIPPGDPLEEQLLRIWEEVLNVRPIGMGDRFFDRGGHSLLAVRLFARIEQTWGKSLPLSTLFQAPTVGQMAALLREQSGPPQWSCLVPIRPAGARPPFFCMHGAGANILYLHTLSRYLPPDQPFYGIQSLGLDEQQEPQTRVEEMAALYLSEIRTVQPEGPYFLGGYSFGGVVAFEMAQQLLAQGQPVAFVAMFNSAFHGPRYISDITSFRAKVYPRVEAAEDRLAEMRASIARHAELANRLGRAGYLRKEAGVVGRMLWRVVETAAGKLIHPLLRRGYPRRRPAPVDETALPPHLMRIWKLNLKAEGEYRPRVYPGRVTLFWASEMPVTFHDRYSPLGWNEFAGEGLEVHVVPGNHTTFREEPHVRVLAAKLTACLERAQEAGRSACVGVPSGSAAAASREEKGR